MDSIIIQNFYFWYFMKSIFTILAVLLFSLPLRASDSNNLFEAESIIKQRTFYNNLVSFCDTSSCALLYLGAGSTSLSCITKEYAKPLIIGSSACFLGHILFKSIGRVATGQLILVDILLRKEMQKRDVESTSDIQPPSITIDLIEQAPVTNHLTIAPPIAVEDVLAQHYSPSTVEADVLVVDQDQPATKQLIVATTIVVEDGLAQHHSPSTVDAATLGADQDQPATNLTVAPPITVGTPANSPGSLDPKDDSSDISSIDWEETAKMPVAPTDYSLSNAIQYIGRATAPYFLWWSRKPKTD
jgi:hypothetical protein